MTQQELRDCLQIGCEDEDIPVRSDVPSASSSIRRPPISDLTGSALSK